ncbi:hypothetical protein Patl1_27578 [Pistacia atlantica]|uniref:Uncharacterized protein n=2 Tax=Pistacia TaxID=55512 RepID=A0ACC1BEH8_9ROSI|nr:hypothetical protein Patl1_27578 [Pistacia atlantica]
MAVVFGDLNSASGLKKLDEYLLTRSYITGYQASKDDITVYVALSKAPSSEYVNVSRWYNHIDALIRISGVSAEGSGVTVEGFAPITEEEIATPPAKASSAAATEDDDDDVDLFGEETEEEKKAAEEREAAVKASGKKNPWDDETDMKKIEEAVRSVQMEGLLWGASKLVPVVYGIKKLQIMLTIVDDLVSVDNFIEEHLMSEPINEYVQSCDRQDIIRESLARTAGEVSRTDKEEHSQTNLDSSRRLSCLLSTLLLLRLLGSPSPVSVSAAPSLHTYSRKKPQLLEMAVVFGDLNSATGLKKLDEYLLTRSYITGYQASKDDITVYAALSKAPSSEYVNVSRWYNHIDALLRISGVSAEGSGVTVGGICFYHRRGDCNPSSKGNRANIFIFYACSFCIILNPYMVLRQQLPKMMMMMLICLVRRQKRKRRLLKSVQAAVKASGKKKESGKSSVLLEVKPWDDETDMKKLEEAVRSVQMEGLLWGASKLVPVGYGIKKLQIMLTIVDDLVSVDNLIEEHLNV